MKKVLALILTICMVVSALASCGHSNNDSLPNDDKEQGGDRAENEESNETVKNEQGENNGEGSNNDNNNSGENQNNNGNNAGGNNQEENPPYVPQFESTAGLEFQLNPDTKSYTLVGIGTCIATNIVIDGYQGLPVTTIGAAAFYNCDGLTSVNIGNGVTSIGAAAFDDCTGLTSVNIPNSVTSIGGYAFSGCDGLTSITIPNGVVSIGSYAFYLCEGLTSITIPNSVTIIDDSAFKYCDGLTIINYRGTEEQWKAISKSAARIPTSCEINYNYTGE